MKSKGLQTIVNWSLKRDRSEVYKEIVKNKETDVTVYVHHSCRRRFTDPRTRSTNAAEVSSAKRLRSAENNFDWKQGRSQKVPKGGRGQIRKREIASEKFLRFFFVNVITIEQKQ